jgi:hypothetical protein
MGSRRLRLVLACAATVAVLGPLAWFWQASLLPGAYSVAGMGYPDYGGGPAGAGMPHMAHMEHSAAEAWRLAAVDGTDVHDPNPSGTPHSPSPAGAAPTWT